MFAQEGSAERATWVEKHCLIPLPWGGGVGSPNSFSLVTKGTWNYNGDLGSPPHRVSCGRYAPFLPYSPGKWNCLPPACRAAGRTSRGFVCRSQAQTTFWAAHKPNLNGGCRSLRFGWSQRETKGTPLLSSSFFFVGGGSLKTYTPKLSCLACAPYFTSFCTTL